MAEGLIQVLERYDNYDMPLNIGFEEDISIKELAEKIKNLIEYSGEIIWDLNFPNGQMKKLLNCSRMKKYNIKINQTSLDEGLIKTINWYRKYGKNRI